MNRERIVLDGVWQFQFDGTGDLSPGRIQDWRAARVPAPWQAQFDDLREKYGVGWYRCTFAAPGYWDGAAAVLHFGAVDYHTTVWLNEVLLGEHEGGYLPFEFEVSRALLPGANNELVVRAVDPGNDRALYPDFPFDEIPHGKQSWYGPLGGIWQSVWLERRSPLHVRSLRLFPDLASGRVEARLSIYGARQESLEVHLRVLDPAGATVAEGQEAVAIDEESVVVSATVFEPLPWSPDHPHLYRCEVQLVRDGEVVDKVEESFGFRTIAARDGQLFLNGEPIYLRGALDQDYYPGLICTPPSTEFLEDQLRKAREMGLNCLRCHIKVADPRYYEVADRLGMLIWTELPNWRFFTEQAAQRAKETLQGILERDGNHPSIIIWTIINENWGTDLVHDSEHRAWLKEMYRWLKELDPTRLVVDNSPCWDNFHIQTDIDDYHHYRAIPDHRQEWDRFVAEFAERAAWTSSHHGDAVRTGREPLIVSEFGNWGLPDVELLRDADGREPWWSETGFEWGDGVVYPHNVQRRFELWGLKRVFGDWRRFVAATQWQQFLALKYEVESIRRRPEIVGYVITELTDVHWEANGLLDMNRNPKAYHSALAAINAETMIAPRWQRVAYWAGEPVEIGLTVAHGAATPIAEAVLEWALAVEDSVKGAATMADLRAAAVQDVGSAAFTAPDISTPTSAKVNLMLRAADGSELASNHVDLAVFPRRNGPVDPDATVWSSNLDLSARLAALGYKAAAERESATVVVANQLTEELIASVRAGGRLLLLAGEPDALGPGMRGLNIAARLGTPWQGDWASSFTWVRRDGPFAGLPGGPFIDHSFDRVIPECVLLGFTPWDFAAHVYAGLFVGWIHKPVALIAEKRYGRGKLVTNTFRLARDAPGADPVATTLLDGLVELAVSG